MKRRLRSLVLSALLLPIHAQQNQLTDHERILLQEKQDDEQEVHFKDSDARVERQSTILTQQGLEIDKLESDERTALGIGKWLLVGILTPSIVGVILNILVRKGQQRAAEREKSVAKKASETHDLVNTHMQSLLAMKDDLIAAVRQELEEAKKEAGGKGTT